VALGPEDFFVSAANEQAFAMVTAPGSWPEGKLALIGPPGSGKSHLARVFAQDRGAMILQAEDLTATFAPPLARDFVVENVERLPVAAEETLFHLHNNLRGRGMLLMTSDRPPSRWTIALPDLASRMQATAIARIDDPDDKLFEAVLLKLFQDRQITPSPDLPAYLAARVERSFAVAKELVVRLDALALAEGRKVNVRLAAKVLDNDPSEVG
jgi:chromosomal replication initiation ATPase DnaA